MGRNRWAVVALSAVVGASGACASKTFVKETVASQVEEIEQQVANLERSLEDATGATGRNAARIREVDQTALSGFDTAMTAHETALGAQTTADTVDEGLRYLLLEVILTEDQGRFGFADAALPEPAALRLDELVMGLPTQARDLHIEIEGHTDATGPAEYNKRLGLERAEAVRRYLHEQHRLPLHRMSVISLGEDRPIDTNDTPQGRARNRRVVLRVLG